MDIRQPYQEHIKAIQEAIDFHDRKAVENNCTTERALYLHLVDYMHMVKMHIVGLEDEARQDG